MTATTLHISLRSPLPGSQAILAAVTVVFETSISGGALKKVSVSFYVLAMFQLRPVGVQKEKAHLDDSECPSFDVWIHAYAFMDDVSGTFKVW